MENAEKSDVYVVLSKLRKTIISINMSGSRFDKLKALNPKMSKLKVDVKTRWSSTFEMVNSFV